MKKNINKIRANELGLHYAKNILEMDDEVKQLKKVIGAGFWKSFSNGFKKGFCWSEQNDQQLVSYLETK